MIIWKWIIPGVRAFRVYNFSSIYEILDFMFEANAVIYGVFEVLVEFTVLVWVIVWGVWVWWVWIRKRLK